MGHTRIADAPPFTLPMQINVIDKMLVNWVGLPGSCVQGGRT